MLNYETLLIFLYFLILFGGQSTFNNCIRSTCHLFREKQKLAKTKIVGWVINFIFHNFILIIIILLQCIYRNLILRFC